MLTGDRFRRDVILNGGEAGVRDRTGAEGFGGVKGKHRGAGSGDGPGDAGAAGYASWGPSKGFALLRMTSLSGMTSWGTTSWKREM